MDNMSKNLLPYIIIFAIIFFINLSLLTWVLSVWYKSHQCIVNPNIWCSDTWTCNNNCTGSSYNECFNHGTSEGLASCLFGPNAPGAQVCFKIQGTGPTCNCSQGMKEQTNNCFSGCPINLREVSKNTRCCCQPGRNGCSEFSQCDS